MFSLHTATPEERTRLGALRASAWKGIFSEEQFVTRNDRLYAHPYGRDHITTYTLKDDRSYLCASMDILDIDLMAAGETLPGYLVASVITAPQDRKKGYASRLLNLFLDKFPQKPGVLYSDIGPPFYERMGFRAKLMRSREVEAAPGELGAPLAFEVGAERLRAERKKVARRGGAVVLPSPLWLDWHLERYRYFAEISQRSFPPHAFYQTSHGGHLLFAAPHFPASRLEVLWITQGCGDCQSVAKALASSHGLASVLWWDEALEAAAGKTECPMIRLPGTQNSQFVDPQLCDWW